MSDFYSEIREFPGNTLNENTLRNKAHELLDNMNDEQIAQIIPYLKTLL